MSQIPVQVKVCGLRTPDEVAVAAQAGAAYVGLMFFARSPRHLELPEARALAAHVSQQGVRKVAVTVNADDAYLDEIVAQTGADMLQLHGHEPPERVSALRARHGLPVMKVVGVAGPEDLPQIDRFAAVADQLLIETKPNKEAKLPGGNGVPFDWRLVAGRRWPVPWMLAGGLTAQNVGEAIAQSGAGQVDVSSGVEAAPGQKDPAKVQAFLEAARRGHALLQPTA